MASTRSKATTHSATQSHSAETPETALVALVRHAARIQIATYTAAAKTLADWAQMTDRLAQTLGDDLLHRVDGETGSDDLVARITTAGSTHLRELTALPRTAVDHFDMRLGRVPNRPTTRRF